MGGQNVGGRCDGTGRGVLEAGGEHVPGEQGTLFELFVPQGGGAAAFLLWTWALSRITPTQVAGYVNLNPIVAALLAILLLGERRSALFLLGFAAVVTGVLLVNWPGDRA